MQLPILPTDNLYKFMALAGLIGFAFCVVVPILFIQKTRPRLTQLAIASRTLALELKYSTDDIERADRKPLAQLREKDIPSDQLEKVRDLEVQSIKLDETEKELKWNTEIMYIYMIFICLGLSLSGYGTRKGFDLWFERTQKPMDEILRYEAAMAKQNWEREGSTS